MRDSKRIENFEEKVSIVTVPKKGKSGHRILNISPQRAMIPLKKYTLQKSPHCKFSYGTRLKVLYSQTPSNHWKSLVFCAAFQEFSNKSPVFFFKVISYESIGHKVPVPKI